MQEQLANGDTSMPDDRVEKVLKDLGVLNPTDASLQPADRLLALATDSSKADGVLDALFPGGIPADSAFYDVVDELWKWISIGEKSDKATGHLWARALQRMNSEHRERLLSTFVEERRHDLFMLLDSLPFVLAEIALPTRFLSEWLTELYKRVERDLAQAGFWNAVRALCLRSASEGIDLLSSLLKSSTPEAHQIATVLLGILRGLALDTTERDAFSGIEASLEASAKPELQNCWIWSWVTTAREYGLTADQLDRLLAFTGALTEHDTDSKLGAVCRLLPIENLDAGVFARAFQWAASKIHSDVSRAAKYHIADTSRALQRRVSDSSPQEVKGLPPVAWSRWVVAIQPVEVTDAGTWGSIERYLVDLLAADTPLFCEVLFDLAAANGDGLLKVIIQPRSFDWLLRQMNSAPVSGLVGELMLSRSGSSRRLGMRLFDELDLEAIDPAIVATSDDREVKLLFYEMQRSLLNPKTNARLMVSLLPRAKSIGGEFTAEVNDELALQVRNFPGGFREELNRLGSEMDGVKKILDEAESQFKAHRDTRDSAVRAMRVPGTRRAAVLHERRMSRQISSGMEEHSVLMKLVKKVRLLYGQTTSSYFDGNLHNPLPLVPHSSSFELPFVDYCDPELMSIRRLHASAAIAALEK